MSILRLQTHFDALVDLTPEAWPAALRELGLEAGEQQLLRRMLEADRDEQAGPVEQAAERLPQLLRAMARQSDPAGRIGQRLGAYELVEVLGQGGMGTVYRGQRDDGNVSHQAAIKVIAELDPDGLLSARIAAERQLLASLEHPGIARFLDAGCDLEGRPWLAMELVEGLPLLEYASRRRLTVTARVELLLEVCAAVDYAHARLVVHRDLKSSNVLVQADGRPRLLDFGIARSLEQPGPQTGTAERFLSPASAAPEQLLGQPASVAIDIYALGALLYQLLGGTAALELTDLPPVEIQRRILSATPTLLSVGLRQRSALADPKVVAATTSFAHSCGGESPAGLARLLRGDLEQIVARCLRKLPAERYSSVAALAADLTRYLRCEPVTAQAPSLLYRTRRFVQRNRWLVLATSAVIVVLSALSIGLWRQSERLLQERDAQVRARAQAERVSDFLVGLFTASSPREAGGAPMSARELLDRGLPRLLNREQADPADAELLLAMAGAYADLGVYEPAERAWQRAQQLQLAEADQRDGQRQLRTGAQIATGLARFDQALALLDRALAQAGSEQLALRQQLRRQRSRTLFAIGKIEAAQAELKTARLELDADPDASLEVKAELDMAEGRLLAVAGQAKTGLELLKQGLSLRRRLLGAGDPALADTLTEVARAASYVGEREVVRSHYGEALQIYRKAFGGHHEAVAQVVNGLGILALGEGDLAEALKLLREALLIRLELLGPNHPSLASSRMNVAAVLRRQGEFAAALAEILNAEDIAAHAWPDGHVNRDLFALERGIILTELGRTEEAAALLWRLRTQFATSSVPQPRNLARTELALADVCQRLGDSAASTEWLSRAAPVIEARYPENDLNRQQLQSVRARMAQSAPGRRQPLCRGAGSP